MQRNPKKIAEEIMNLVSELVKMTDGTFEVGRSELGRVKSNKETSGATGGLRLLLVEQYFDQPRQLPEIIEKLKEEGRHYSNATISMGLLNLVKERLLTRFRDKKVKKWNYVIRK
jgi:hypothetical protein